LDAKPPFRDPEARWPAAVVLLLALLLIYSLPERYREVPVWFPWGAISIGLAAMIGVSIAPASLFWRRTERWVILSLSVLAGISNVWSIYSLATDMVAVKHDISSITLLESAITIWTNNLLVFALIYWQLDRAEPDAPVAKVRATAADFSFAERDDPMAAGWQPEFIDYLYLSFAVSTTFTAPDHSRPTGHRAKVLIMIQGLIALVTLFLIAARAIGTLS
jgi:hypothetical protein